ncbi:MAG: fused protease/ribonucleoside-triphosphate reductase, partial [bacterium]
DHKAQRAAKDAYDRLFHFKWTPPGRGMWAMGTRMVHEGQNSAALYNCAWISTEKITSHSKYEATLPFVRLMEMSMWGIGVGFDTRGAGKINLHQPSGDVETYVVPDTREGWAASVGRLLESYFLPHQRPVKFDYSKVRPAGSPLKTFGGTASGPGPLKDLHKMVVKLLNDRAGEPITSRDIVDIQNLIGKAVVAGGARRSAELALGFADDEDYVTLKNWNLKKNKARTGANGWAWMSNNSVYAGLGMDYTDAAR